MVGAADDLRVDPVMDMISRECAAGADLDADESRAGAKRLKKMVETLAYLKGYCEKMGVLLFYIR